MSRVKGQANYLLQLAASDSEDSGFMLPLKGRASSTTKMAPATKPRGRPAANKVTKAAAKPANRRLSDRIAAATVKQSEERTALSEKTANSRTKAKGRTTREAVDDAGDVDEKPARGRPKRAPTNISVEPTEIPESTNKKTSKRSQPHDFEIPETQQVDDDAMDVDLQEESAAEDQLPDSLDLSIMPHQTAALPAYSAHRPAAMSSPERSDPALRRRLGDMTKKYESLQLRYRDLREVAIRDAERNFDKLKKDTDQRSDAANQLMAALKSELAHQRAMAGEVDVTNKRLQEREADVLDLKATVQSLERALSDAKGEIRNLSAKLSAVRSGDAAGARGPGSAMKPGARAGAASDTAIASSQAAQMKEDLYGDLTGLIIRGIKREGNEDIFDCIQTGRNGTLHFKLAVGNDNTSSDFDEAQFTYMPQLDASRDGELMDLLPDYLVDEISFPRPQAAKFYARVMKVLTERME